MRIGHKQAVDEILVLGGHAGAALASPPLRPVGRERHPLDIAGVADRHDHVFAGDKVFVLHIRPAIGKLGAAGRRKLVTYRNQLVLDDLLDARAGGENFEIILDLDTDFLKLVGNFFPAKRCQTREPQFENGLGLFFGEEISAVLVQLVARISDQQNQRRNILGRPAALHQLGFGRCRIGSPSDERDDLVNIGNGNRQPHQNMRPVARLFEQKFRAAADNFLAERDKGAQHVEQRHQLRLAAVQRHHVAAE